MLTGLKFFREKTTILHFDFQSAMRLIFNSKFQSQTKCVHIKYHMISKQIKNGVLQTNDTFANIFTKALSPKKFKEMHALLTIHLA
uniref:Uncharacterized protein n=1 Tax=Physcomitrium patens TaxID=3218 RepID=A0A7I3ZI16_PHYPA